MELKSTYNLRQTKIRQELKKTQHFKIKGLIFLKFIMYMILFSNKLLGFGSISYEKPGWTLVKLWLERKED